MKFIDTKEKLVSLQSERLYYMGILAHIHTYMKKNFFFIIMIILKVISPSHSRSPINA